MTRDHVFLRKAVSASIHNGWVRTNSIYHKALLPNLGSPSTDDEEKYGDRVWKKQKRVALLLLPGKRGTQQASVSRTVPYFPGEQGKVIQPGARGLGQVIRLKVIKVLHFFSFANSWPELASGGAATRSGVPEYIGRDILSEMKSATRERRGRRNARCKE